MSEMGNRLTAWIERGTRRLGIPQKDVAARAGMSRTYLNDVYHGGRPPSLRLLSALAMVFEESPDYAYSLAGYLPPAMEGATEAEIHVMVAALEEFRNITSEYLDDVENGRGAFGDAMAEAYAELWTYAAAVVVGGVR